MTNNICDSYTCLQYVPETMMETNNSDNHAYIRNTIPGTNLELLTDEASRLILIEPLIAFIIRLKSKNIVVKILTFNNLFNTLLVETFLISWLERKTNEEGKKTAARPRNSYIGQIKCDAKVKTFKELKEKASNRLEWRIGTNLRHLCEQRKKNNPNKNIREFLSNLNN
ncbi:Uncharacterized protein FWK35_00000077 [Aphis craccivora]|uniref:Uncharacterized protein n=1 Tax=Aphis craccivora TaxID=307492 RepID=A0A6G0ZP60_APHCR|nr:Uncharacterized protein FWK35_00000077 [Aphis craccivora]